jgi:hypothetical protein
VIGSATEKVTCYKDNSGFSNTARPELVVSQHQQV